MGTDKKDKFGLWSIVLLGINGIIGTGIFLLPNRAYALMGPSSLLILLFDAFLAGCLALCFAEVAGFFSRNGGPYLYAKAAFGDFVGYEVGVLKLVVTIIAWAAMAVGFATALGAAFPFFCRRHHEEPHCCRAHWRAYHHEYCRGQDFKDPQ